MLHTCIFRPHVCLLSLVHILLRVLVVWQVTTALEDTGLDEHEEHASGELNGVVDEAMGDQRVVAKFLVRLLTQDELLYLPRVAALPAARWVRR